MSMFGDVVRPVVVRDRAQLARDVIGLELTAANGRPLPPWTPGSHVDLLLPGGEERQYSLCSDPVDRSAYRVAVLREPDGRGGSALVHDGLPVGTTVRVRGPRNHFPFDAVDERTVLVAGGIGITPFVSMIDAAEAAGVPWELHYAGRSRSTMAFVEDLVAAHPDRVTVYAADEGRRLDVGAVLDGDGGGAGDGEGHDAAPGAGRGPGGRLYCCGPRRLVDAAEAAVAERAGWSLHAERFEAREVGPPVWAAPFEVELALTGTTVTVPPERSILEVAEESGAVVVSSCRTGTCGSCETPVLEGTVEHRDSVIGPDGSSTSMMICVSRAACPRLVLEL